MNLGLLTKAGTKGKWKMKMFQRKWLDNLGITLDLVTKCSQVRCNQHSNIDSIENLSTCDANQFPFNMLYNMILQSIEMFRNSHEYFMTL